MARPFAYLATLSVFMLHAQGGQTIVNPGNSMKAQLAGQIVARNGDHAKYLAARMSPDDVGEVLAETSSNPKDSVRLLTLEIASGHPSVGTSRAILSRLFDSDLAIRSVAAGLIGRCQQRSMVPELIETMRKDLPLDIKGALARQVGIIGGPEAVEPLNKFHTDTREQGYRRDLSLAMARLGQTERKTEAVKRLEANARVQALRDIEYIGDRTLVRHLGEVLKDRRDVLDITPPHEFPVVWVRVCDVAVQSMAILGVPFSFGGHMLNRWDERQLAEAVTVVEAMKR
jgi:hypothetical protein